MDECLICIDLWLLIREYPWEMYLIKTSNDLPIVHKKQRVQTLP
jgi:hypothetical protein